MSKHNVNPHVASLEDSLGIPSGDGEVYVNPLDIARSYEFRKPFDNSTKDYRERAIDRCIRSKVSFTSETNCLRNLVQRMMPTVNCPACKKQMKLGDSGGNFTATTFSYSCNCGCKVGLTFSAEAISVALPNETK